MADDNRIDRDALAYHRASPAGKLGIVATKPLANQRDLALAYSPGVAAACRAVAAEPAEAATVTARGNLVAVISNGTAVLGLGPIGALASKPVMEGKAVLFKKFAGIDVFDIEVDETDPDRFVEVVAALEPTFGAVNLEDIKAPECFEIEQRLRERMNIPVFHDDQHGTAIIVAAAIWNGLSIVGKKIETAKLVTSGAGAAALACLDLLVDLGMKVENIVATDIHGVVYEGRKEEMDARKARYAKKTDKRTLAEVIDEADIFLGLSAPGVLKPEMVKRMAKKPLILALANPVPEITPEEAREARSDAVIATGRSDYPNQVNNVLCFPFIFRGALDVGATDINEAMKIACVHALANLARAEASDIVLQAYGGQAASFGPDYLIPRPFDPRLITAIAPAVAKAAMDSGVATRPIADFDAYRMRLDQFVFRSGLVMKPLFDAARADPQRIVYAEGESERVLRAVQVVVDEGLARPVLIGRRRVVTTRIRKFGLRLKVDADFELCDPEDDPRYDDYWNLYHNLLARRGVSPSYARTVARTRTTVIACLMLRRGEVDAAICGTSGMYQRHLGHARDVIGLREGVSTPAALTVLIVNKGTYFLADTHVNVSRDAAGIAEMALLVARETRLFGIEPKIALLSHSNFGSVDSESARRMRDAVALLQRGHPELEVEGEMHADTALVPEVRERFYPDCRLQGSANVMIMPSLDAANISYNLLKVLGEGLSVGPILLGMARPIHIVTPSISKRGLVNMTAVAAVDAQTHRAEGGERR
ncbi:MAG: NADP-dependent malic enzyme [Rhodospirillales bacterium]|nr:MAG: NADP-dependent malic enzyme [Rhodospirillales bacterium]